MSNTFNQQQRAARHAARRAFVEHDATFVQLPSAKDNVTETQSQLLENLRRRMVDAGLYSPTSEASAARWGIRLLVSELRGQGVDKSQRYGW